ncbi:beta-ketoacyl-[acyl-carrier-protein] synthase family protein [Sulfurimonas sp. HSL3-7]|uniref:beta-ketoacyl-[acyl-carrier-protein] synthase family protein n=1 Tax=Sulfonitrofixus jiaomeiensis TaxID=3131938 RepID=UPI0031F7F3E8
MLKNRVFVNAYESLSCAGNTQELMNAIYAKESGITIDTSYMPHNRAGLGSFAPNAFFSSLVTVTQEVLNKSNLDDFSTTLLIVGSSVGGIGKSEQIFFREHSYKNINPKEHAISVISDTLNRAFGFKDSRSISTACTSSANAIMLAQRLINIGAYENVLVVGADALCYTTVCGFYALGVLSDEQCTPFQKERKGMNVAEGIAAVLLQGTRTDESVELLGSAGSSDAFHMTNPDPEAGGAISCMQKAIEDAGIMPTDIDYVNAHGTGTQANDAVEALAVETLFAHSPYMSSTKAITGHTLGAAGALEAIIACEVIKAQRIAPQTSLTEAENTRVNLPIEAVEKKVRYVISNSFAFGGNNTALVFGALK